MRLNFWREDKGRTGKNESPGLALDYELAERISKGDHDALARWLDRHLGEVYGYAARRLGPGLEQLAEEVTCATFEEAIRHLKPYANGTASTPMRLWLLRLANGQLARRRDKIKGSPFGDGESAQLAKLRRTMRAMPPRREAALALALFEGMPAEEIASASGVPVSWAMRRLRSALKQARPAVEVEYEEGAHG